MGDYRLVAAISEGKLHILGHICFNWSALEFLVRRTVETIEGNPQPDPLAPETRDFDMTRWRKALKQGAKKLQSEAHKRFLHDIASSIKCIQPERNLAIHGYWIVDENNRLHAYTFRRGRFHGANPMDHARLKRLNDEVVDLSNALREFLEKWQAELPSSPQKP